MFVVVCAPNGHQGDVVRSLWLSLESDVLLANGGEEEEEEKDGSVGAVALSSALTIQLGGAHGQSRSRVGGYNARRGIGASGVGRAMTPPHSQTGVECGHTASLADETTLLHGASIGESCAGRKMR